MKKEEKIRHSLAHLLADAVVKLYPNTLPTIGPVIDNGFYYDFDLPSSITEKDLQKIEDEMKKNLKNWGKFEEKEVSVSEAREFFKDNKYKLELIGELEEEGSNITFYTSGDFVDLCVGGHVSEAKEIPSDAWKLDRVAGAYWRGDEKNKMLTRIYGLAFETKQELDNYLKMREEAEKRDHKKLGKELGLFLFSDLVGGGLPLWTPKGTIMRFLLDDYVWELRKKKGFQRVTIPHITKKDLYDVSGHWKKFSDELFKISTREGHLFAMKPMNCPHHTQIFDNERRSYRDMPQRYAETTMVYRDEQSGELSGLSRVRSITQDDAHVFCRENQIENEMYAIWDIVDDFYKTFGFDLKVRFSRHDPEIFDNYIGTKEVWSKAETQLLSIIKKRGVDYMDGLGEAAMYGPKIDFIAKDSLGRVLQVATIQLDFNMPTNFNLSCINEKGEKEGVVMIHCAIMGSIERFMSTLIEHYAGAFPVWLSPIQAKILPVSEKHIEYAKSIYDKLLEEGIRVELDSSNETLGKKVRDAKMQKIPYLLVVGDKEIESKEITVEFKNEKVGSLSINKFLERIQKEIKNRDNN